MTYFVANGMGDSIDAPSLNDMRAFLAAIDRSDEEHGAAWLATDEGWSLEWNGDGRLVLSIGEAPGRHLANVSPERTLALWSALAEKRFGEIEAEPWLPGDGYVQTPERARAIAEWQQQQDREFYDALGDERRDVPCREPGCTRGAVELSVLCRRHHFEMVKRRCCPFTD